MTRRGWASRGSTRAWRMLRASVLERDNHTCQVPTVGGICGQPATTAGHLIPRAHGGSDELANLRAECIQHNCGDGAAIARGPQRTGWRW